MHASCFFYTDDSRRILIGSDSGSDVHFFKTRIVEPDLHSNRFSLLLPPPPPPQSSLSLSPAFHQTGGVRRRGGAMKFQIEEVTVYFPYEHIYPEQYGYMAEMKRALDARGHALLEMPTGTGKTSALLSLILSYSLHHFPHSTPLKLLYCTRTVHEMEKTLSELRLLLQHLPPNRILALGLSSRKNLCVNPLALSAASRDSVDSACRRLTASWVRSAAAADPSVPTCSFFESFDRAADAGPDNVVLLPPGVYTLQDLRALGRDRGWCPYFLARHMIRFASVVVYSYQYLLDPKVATIISREMQRECVVVFDEAHNIDNVCIEALSVSVRKQTLDGATRNLSRMAQEIDR